MLYGEGDKTTPVLQQLVTTNKNDFGESFQNQNLMAYIQNQDNFSFLRSRRITVFGSLYLEFN